MLYFLVQDPSLQYQCSCSFYELYNERVFDLLNPNASNLNVRENVRSGVYVENLTTHAVTRYFMYHGCIHVSKHTHEYILQIYITYFTWNNIWTLDMFIYFSASEVLFLAMDGAMNRRVAATTMNRESSRSHALFCINVTSKVRAGLKYESVESIYSNLSLFVFECLYADHQGRHVFSAHFSFSSLWFGWLRTTN